jgi:spermidine/putrescine transport system substrate-binding protein
MITEREGSNVGERELVGLVRQVARGRISRRQFLERGLALGLSISAVGSILAACGGEDEEGQVQPQASYASSLPETLYLYNWTGYEPPAVLKGFEKKYGVKVKETYYQSNEEMLAKLKGGATGYDVIVPSDYTVSIMIKSGMLQPLQMDLIPNFANVEEFLDKPVFDPETDGKKYSVPYAFGTAGVAVRNDKFVGDVTSWQTMWDPTNKNDMTMLDDERQTIGAALFLLGYSINTTDQAELDEAKAKLIEQKPLLLKYDSMPARAIVQGNPLTHTWDGEIMLAAKSVPIEKIDYVLPEEGQVNVVDNFVIPTGGASPYAAHLFMNYMLDTEVSAACHNWSGYQTAVATAAPLIKDPAQQALRPTSEQLSKGQFILDVGEFGRQYSQAWQDVKSA